MLYDNYPKWATVEKENGLKEGLKKGRVEERAVILEELLASLKTKLSERFGTVPRIWTDSLAKITNPVVMVDLASWAYSANSPEEFEARFLDITR